MGSGSALCEEGSSGVLVAVVIAYIVVFISIFYCRFLYRVAHLKIWMLVRVVVAMEYSPAVFINASPEACSAFDFFAFTGALQSEVFIGGQGSDDELLSDVFVGG
ncbi:hypothetical protein PVAP13_9KG030356 [Panicum virgatum]|uniref:Uncharacterized protein n=1 Tax=Panicum virgatum TaxID=38727 RepID=A0A8T0NDW2_PANVG|nr:hypothetical protein PVAP13_9KG030356 [Panicum virgatum]